MPVSLVLPRANDKRAALAGRMRRYAKHMDLDTPNVWADELEALRTAETPQFTLTADQHEPNDILVFARAVEAGAFAATPNVRQLARAYIALRVQKAGILGTTEPEGKE